MLPVDSSNPHRQRVDWDLSKRDIRKQTDPVERAGVPGLSLLLYGCRSSNQPESIRRYPSSSELEASSNLQPEQTAKCLLTIYRVIRCVRLRSRPFQRRCRTTYWFLPVPGPTYPHFIVFDHAHSFSFPGRSDKPLLAYIRNRSNALISKRVNRRAWRSVYKNPVLELLHNKSSNEEPCRTSSEHSRLVQPSSSMSFSEGVGGSLRSGMCRDQ